MSSKTNALLLLNVISAKGGVGKSTLAIMSAVYLARKHGMKTWVIDADFSGTSIVEGLSYYDIKPKRQKHLHDYLAMPPITDLKDLEKNITDLKDLEKMQLTF